MRLLQISLILLALALPARAEILAYNSAESVLNAFIATYAKETVEWKKDIRLGATPGQVEPGRQLGQTVAKGYYTFIPKLWSDLSPDEQHRVLKDPRLRAFIISSRSASTYGLAGNSQKFPIEGPAQSKQILPETRSDAGAQSGAVTSATTETKAAPMGPIVIRVQANSLLKGDTLKVDVDSQTATPTAKP